MGNFKLCFALIFLYLFESISGYQSQHNHGSFDFFVIAQQWPQTSCFELNHIWQKADDTCTACKTPNFWTLHGLWPNNEDHSGVSHCNTKVTFKPNLLSNDLKAQLEDKWRSYHIKSKNNYGFLSHEWKQHGSCALSAQKTNSLTKYFSAGLALLDLYNVGTILEKNQIVPGRHYDFFDIYNAISSTVNVNVNVRCANNPITKEQYLQEVRVCVDTSFNLIDCNDDKHISNCSYKKKVVYPKTLKTC